MNAYIQNLIYNLHRQTTYIFLPLIDTKREFDGVSSTTTVRKKIAVKRKLFDEATGIKYKYVSTIT